jgi:glycosyltransferase involved in cell wall biosynthesis
MSPGASGPDPRPPAPGLSDGDWGLSPRAGPTQSSALSPQSYAVAAVIPAWNEAEALGPLLAEIRALPAGAVDQVVVVDARSTDATAAMARAGGAEVVTQQRRGYGAACWEGFVAARAAGAAIVAFLDGDGSDPPAALPAIVAPVRCGEADLVLGVRRPAPGGAGALPWHARAGNALVRLLLRWRTGQRVADLPSMKAIAVAQLDALQMAEMGYGWTTEMIAKALRRGLRVREVDVHVRPRTGGVSKVSGNVGASVVAGFALLRTAFRATTPGR